jgi:predicted ArsR family transcriptional regulator
VHGSIREEGVMIANWVDEIEEDVRTVLNERGSLSARELGRRLGVSEDTAVSFIGLLAASGHLVIERVSLPDAAGVTCDTMTPEVLLTAA